MAAAALIVALSSVVGAVAWARARAPKPDAILAAQLMPLDAPIEWFAIPIDASRWAGIGLLDVDVSGSPRWKIHITDGTPNGGAPQPRPDGKGWTFGRTVPDSGVLDIVDIDINGRERRLTYARGDDYQPAWAPDNSAFAFTTMRWSDRARYDIAVYDAVTQTVRQLTHGQEIDHTPYWSADGSRIAFVRQLVPSGVRSLCVMDADGANLRCLESETATDLALIGWNDPFHTLVMHGESQRLLLMDVDSGTVELIDPGAMDASLSPDGKWVACMCARRGYPQRSTVLFPVQRPNEFKLLRVIGAAPADIAFLWAPTSPRLPYVDAIRIVGGPGQAILGASYQLRVVGADSSGQSTAPGVIRWNSRDTTIAVVDSTGLVTPRRTGSALIEALAGGWRHTSTQLTITRACRSPRCSMSNGQRACPQTGVPLGSHDPKSSMTLALVARSGIMVVKPSTAVRIPRERFRPRRDCGWILVLSSPITAAEWQRQMVRFFWPV